jgi:hypothetical protein
MLRFEKGRPSAFYSGKRESLFLVIPTLLIENLSGISSDGYLPQTRRYDKRGMDPRYQPAGMTTGVFSV